MAVVSSGGDESCLSNGEVIEWISRIQQWDSSFFTLSRVPSKYRRFVSKFLRRVIITRMAECPELASTYHLKLKQEYEVEEKLKDPEILSQSEAYLERILDEAERKLNERTYLVGEEFSFADAAFIPVLSRIEILNLEEKYIITRPNVAEYWSLMQKRATYKKVIGKYFHGFNRHRTLLKTWFLVQIRSLLKQY